MKRIFILLVLVLSVFSVFSQADSKSVRDAIQKGTVRKLTIVADSAFSPGQELTFDIVVEAADGSKARAFERKMIWKEASIFLHGGREREPGRVATYDVDYFYPRKPLTILVELANASDSIAIYPSYHYETFYLLKAGTDGRSGSGGMTGSDAFSTMRAGYGGSGSDGQPGTNGPSLNVVIDEEEIQGEPHIIINVDGQKYPVAITSGAIRIQSKGGRGGHGGDGGNGGSALRFQGRYRGTGGYGGRGGNGGYGGNGGDIHVSGPALARYGDKIEVISIPGDGGPGGRGGFGGSGFYSGMTGDSGAKGADGQPGKVVREDRIEKKVIDEIPKPLPTTIVVTTDISAILIIDGNSVGKISPAKPTKLLVSPGKIEVEVKSVDGNTQYFKQMLDVAEHQQVVKHIAAPTNPPE